MNEQYYRITLHDYAICCGKPATQITTGWISPYCDDCIPQYEGEPFRTIPIEEYYGNRGKAENA